jgi:hypothetical protein
MKRFITSTGLILAALVLTLALAQNMMNQPGNQGESGEMGGMNEMGMQGQMQQMVEQCTNMMQGMQGMMGGMMSQGMGGGMMGQGMQGQGMMGQDTTARYDEQNAEALARAFLAGRSPNAEITQVEREDGAYLFQFQGDGVEGALRVDTNTGEVQLAEDE